MLKNLPIYPCGTEVVTKMGNYKGLIVGISIRWENVLYEVKYIKEDKNFDSYYMNEQEFTVDELVEKVKLSFLDLEKINNML